MTLPNSALVACHPLISYSQPQKKGKWGTGQAFSLPHISTLKVDGRDESNLNINRSWSPVHKASRKNWI